MACLERKLVIFYGFTTISLLAPVSCIDFDRNLFGVEFAPWMKYNKNEEDTSYTYENLKTMLEVVSTKFSRILTFGVDAPEGHYVKNYTYYNTESIRTRTAEAAALINCENKNKSLTVFVGAMTWQNSWLETELSVAVESAQIANSIYPGTVEGIVLMGFQAWSLVSANATLFYLQKLRSMCTGLGLKVGYYATSVSLKLIDPNERDPEVISSFMNFRKQIILTSDFIIYAERFKGNATHGVEHSLSVVSNKSKEFRDEIVKLNNRAEVMLHTYWITEEYDPSNNITTRDLKRFWEGANKFAVENRFPVWMSAAFDIPSAINSDVGWWKLSRNDLINNASGYIEKASGEPVRINFTLNPDDECSVLVALNNFNISKENYFGTNASLHNTVSKEFVIPNSPGLIQVVYCSVAGALMFFVTLKMILRFVVTS